MKTIFLFIMFINSISVLYGQYDIQVYPGKSMPEYELNGSIEDKYDISMSLNFHVREDGDDRNYQIIGYYYYSTIRKYIALSGLLRSDTVCLYEYDENNTVRGIFNGVIKKDSFTGLWTDMVKHKKLSFTLLFERAFSKYDLTYSKGIVLDLKDTLRRENGYSVSKSNCFVDIPELIDPATKIIYTVKKDNFYYVLLESSSITNGKFSTHDYCGAGIESMYIYLKLSQSFVLNRCQFIYYESCARNIESSIERATDPIDFTIEGKDFWSGKSFKYKFIRDHPDSGFTNEK